MNNGFFDTCVYLRPEIELLAEVIDIRNILFGAETVGGIGPRTNHYSDDPNRYIDLRPAAEGR